MLRRKLIMRCLHRRHLLLQRYFFDIGYLIAPTAVGDNFIANGYNLSSGADLRFRLEFDKISAHANIIIHRGRVADKSLVGNFNSSPITRYSLGVGYVLPFTEHLSLNPSIQYGYLKLGGGIPNSQPFLDDAYFVALDIQLSYNITSWLSVYARVTG